eukprot:GAHX01001590.1.p1 GENE.GAHX01001590.1~~GAHX01001590.1.p1  ORF type:complete len:251 (-),score=46.70 GAHX01001590.1:83-835(-)
MSTYKIILIVCTAMFSVSTTSDDTEANSLILEHIGKTGTDHVFILYETKYKRASFRKSITNMKLMNQKILSIQVLIAQLIDVAATSSGVTEQEAESKDHRVFSCAFGYFKILDFLKHKIPKEHIYVIKRHNTHEDVEHETEFPIKSFEMAIEQDSQILKFRTNVLYNTRLDYLSQQPFTKSLQSLGTGSLTLSHLQELYGVLSYIKLEEYEQKEKINSVIKDKDLNNINDLVEMGSFIFKERIDAKETAV